MDWLRFLQGSCQRRAGLNSVLICCPRQFSRTIHVLVSRQTVTVSVNDAMRERRVEVYTVVRMRGEQLCAGGLMQDGYTLYNII